MSKLWKRLQKKIDPEKEEALRNEPLERGDRFAMISAAFMTLFLPALLILLLLGGLICLLVALL